VHFPAAAEVAGGKVRDMTDAASPRFVHLRLRSEFSIVDELVRLDVGKSHACPPVGAARAEGIPALALTDLSNVFGMMKFYGAARRQGVKPIIGCDVWTSTQGQQERPSRLLLLVQGRSR
jgi:DNA polymerase-3 subunit alpha